MLRELHITNFAVIADASIELSRGLNCFTGATGAGKSLVIGALEVLLGLRSPSDMLRAGADEGRVSGVFEIHDARLLKQIADASEVNVDAKTGEVLLTRRLYASGRTSASLNGNPITLGMLKNVAEALVDVHGQHDHQYLLKPHNQLEVLDQFAGLLELRDEYHVVYAELDRARRQLEELAANRTLRKQQLELYRFQANEIDAAELQPAEYEELHSRASVLANLEKLKKDTGAAQSVLYEAEDSVIERLKTTSGIISELAELDGNLKPVADTLRDATIQIEDTAFDLGRYIDKLDLDPSELAQVNDRLNSIHRVLNKYGDTVPLALEYREEIAGKITELERAGDDYSTIEKKIEPLTDRVRQLGENLSQKRKTAATKLSPLIESELAHLGMEKSKFSVAVSHLPAPTPTGFDSVEFICQTNPGLSPQPLRKIASGGEISRIMLALKGVLAQGDRVSVLVFDEIDANVGGRLGSIIGGKLRRLASHHQVLCITHLPQIASYGDRHLTVRKEVAGGQTRTAVRTMDGPERIEELAEMIGGQRITETTRAQAKELLDAARAEIAASRPKPAKRSKAAK